MNTFSHHMIGDILLRHLKEHHGIILNRDAFLRGNVIPDFKHSLKYKPHEPASWMRYIQREIGVLSKHRQESDRFDAAYSRRLGIICHFYADFFCRAHTAAFTGGAYEHVRYEWLLNRYLRARKPILKGTNIGAAEMDGQDAAKLMGDFKELQSDYLGNTPSYDNDIAFTLRACLRLLTAVTRSAMAESREPDGLTITVPQPALSAVADKLISVV